MRPRLLRALGLSAAVLALCACRAAPPSGAEREVAAATRGAQAEPQPAQGFAGLWETSYGLMRLKGGAGRVEGTYAYSGIARIAGDVDGRVLRATYVEPDGTQGRAVFELADDGQSFRGVWRPALEPALELDTPEAGRWSGKRVEPVEGRTWLVILEANWETSLAEHEYSYGDMLRAFFERVPDVAVRHRFFHDRADLLRFCGEVGGLAEPVVLYVSSHGTRAGIPTGGGAVDGQALGAALRDAGNLKLLHLGACELLAGDFASDVRAAAGADFPISGFTQDVDWAGSAIVDFTYLHLVLELGVAPAEAVEEGRAMLSFAGAPAEGQGPIAGCDLTVLAPGAKPATEAAAP